MAGEDQKGPGDAPGKPAEAKPAGKKLDRRDVLLGLSTVPALGLFGYAWRKQHAVRAEAEGGREREDGRGRQGRLRDQRRPPRRGGPGAGAARRHAPDPRPAVPGRVRRLDGVQPEEGREHPQEVQAPGQRVRRLPGDARQGEGPRRGRRRDARLLARPAHHRLPEGRQARLLREGDVEHARGRAEHGARRPRDREAPPDRAPAAQPPALPALLREAPRGGEDPRADRDRERPVEPRGVAGPRLARSATRSPPTG